MRLKNLSVNMSRKMSDKIRQLSYSIILHKTGVNTQKILVVHCEFPNSSSVILYQHVYLTVLYSNITLECVTNFGIKKFSPLYIMLCKFSKFFFNAVFFLFFHSALWYPLTYYIYCYIYILLIHLEQKLQFSINICRLRIQLF